MEPGLVLSSESRILTTSAGVAIQEPGAAEHLHVVAGRQRRVDDLVGVGVERAGEAHSGDAERLEQAVVNDRSRRAAR